MASKRLQAIPEKYQRDAEKQLRGIAKKIQRRREKLGFSQEAFAEKLGIAVNTIKTIEQSRRYPSLPMLFFICRHLGIKISIG
ncbi:helix-turn-helix domain-containing protein [bacterium]|nr:helix-turn-helix domain-containing protein [bacterium]